MSVKFIDNSEQIKKLFEQAAVAGLEEAAGEIQSQAERNSPVDTGQLKGSWGHFVDEGKLEATIGNTTEHSIWQEFGTGEYSLGGNGRKGGWFYEDEEGEGHFTRGNKPVRMLHNAFISTKTAAEKAIRDKIKEALK